LAALGRATPELPAQFGYISIVVGIGMGKANPFE
jgi:hypothetical protein